MKSKLFYFDPKKSFVQLPVLWAVIGFFFALACIGVIIICANTPLTADFSASGFNYFLSVFKFPLGLIALIIPVVALLAANHRSTQTSAQIIAASNQNVFSNYYKHTDEFSRYLSDRIDDKTLATTSHRRLHSAVFPDSMDGDYSVGTDLIETLENDLSQVVELLEGLGAGDTVESAIVEVEFLFREKIAGLGFPMGGISGTMLKSGSRKIVVPRTIRSLFSEISKRAHNIQAILDFDHQFQTPKSLATLLRINISSVPNVDVQKLASLPRFQPFINPDIVDVGA